MKNLFLGITIVYLFIVVLFAFFFVPSVIAKSYIKGYTKSSGKYVKPHIRYKADGYKFNNYIYRPDRGYRR